MITLIVYFVSLILFYWLTFTVLRALNVETLFKQNKIWEIQMFYIIISLVIAHGLASIIVKFLEWALLVFKAN